jgi:hypothetical protein
MTLNQKNIDLIKMFGYEPPTSDHIERRRHRLAFRNESALYHRKCDKTGKQIISMHRPDTPFPVYYYKEWISTDWDARDYGQDYDFNRPFFEQYQELVNKVPHQSLIFSNNENCDFCNIVGNCKNCYLCYGSINCEDCYYGSPFNCSNCVDSLVLRKSEICIEGIDSDSLYSCYKCKDCSNSSDLQFCIDVNNSKNCFACVGLNHKEYCILNVQYAKEEYESFMQKTNLCDPVTYERILKSLNELKTKVPHKYYVGSNNENVKGNYVSNSKDCHEVYFAEKCQDVSFAEQLLDVQDCVEINNAEMTNHCYQICAAYNQVSNCSNSIFLWDGVYNVHYSGNCTQNVKNCFGCEALKHAEYCILNKQYTKEEYEEMLPKIIEHMKSTGEWGQFFPGYLSPFAYNETVANDYYPLTKEEAEAKGYNWHDSSNENKYLGPEVKIPNTIQDVDPKVCDQIFTCEESGKPYKIIPKELEMYKRLNVPLPKRAPKQRHIDRIHKRNPMQLWERQCDKCSKTLTTTYSPDRKEIVYCEECYLAEVY